MFRFFNFTFLSRKDLEKMREEASTTPSAGKKIPSKILWMSEVDKPQPPKKFGNMTLISGGRDDLVRQSAEALYFGKEGTYQKIMSRLARIKRSVSGIRLVTVDGKTRTQIFSDSNRKP